MANRLAMDKTQGIMQLFAAGMSERQIARTLDIDRKSVDRELRLQGAKGANPTKAPTGLIFSVLMSQKGPKRPPGTRAQIQGPLTPRRSIRQRHQRATVVPRAANAKAFMI